MNSMENDHIQGYCTTERGIEKIGTRKNVPLTNFTVTINQIIIARNERRNIQILHLTMYYNISGKMQSISAEIDCTKLDSFEPSDYCISLCIYPGKNTRNEFFTYLRLLTSKIVPIKKILIDQLGDGCIDGKHFYCIGDDIISNSITANECFFTPEVSQFHVDFDRDISKSDAFKVYERCLGIDLGITDIIGLYSVNSFMRKPYKVAKLPTINTLMSVGKTQFRKTTTNELFCCLYNTDTSSKSHTIRLDSSAISIEAFTEQFRTSTVIVDDLFRDTKNQTELKYKAQQIVRQAADKTIRQTTRAAHDITQTQIVLTSEILFDNISDLGRVVLVLIKKPINSEKLGKCVENRSKLLAFYIHYISWIYSNFDTLTQSLNEDLAKLEYLRLQESVPYERLREHCFMLYTTLKYILRYATETRCINDEYAEDLKSRIVQNIRNCYDTQLKIMQYISKKSDEDILMPSKALLACLKAGKIIPADENSDCFIRYCNGVEFLWIRSDMLSFELNKLFGHENSIKYYSNYFARRGILVREANGERNTKRHNGKRYMVIRLDLLAADVDSIESVVDTFL